MEKQSRFSTGFLCTFYTFLSCFLQSLFWHNPKVQDFAIKKANKNDLSSPSVFPLQNLYLYKTDFMGIQAGLYFQNTVLRFC